MTNIKRIEQGLRSETIRWRTHNYEGTIIEMRNFDIQPMSLMEIAAEQTAYLKKQKSELARAKAAIARPEHETKLMGDEIKLLNEFAQCSDNSVDGDIHRAASKDDLYTFVAQETRKSIPKHLFAATLKSLIRKGYMEVESTLSSDYIAFTDLGFDTAKQCLTHVDTAQAPQAATRAATVRTVTPRAAKGQTKKGTVLLMLQDHPTTKEEIAHELAISTQAASSLINDLRRDGHAVESSRTSGSTTYSVGRIPTVDEAALGISASSSEGAGEGDGDEDGTYADRIHDTYLYYVEHEGLSEEDAMARAIEEEPKHA